MSYPLLQQVEVLDTYLNCWYRAAFQDSDELGTRVTVLREGDTEPSEFDTAHVRIPLQSTMQRAFLPGVGQKAEVLTRAQPGTPFSWFDVTITKVQGTATEPLYTVRYDGYSDEYDEIVTQERVRPPGLWQMLRLEAILREEIQVPPTYFDAFQWSKQPGNEGIHEQFKIKCGLASVEPGPKGNVLMVKGGRDQIQHAVLSSRYHFQFLKICKEKTELKTRLQSFTNGRLKGIENSPFKEEFRVSSKMIKFILGRLHGESNFQEAQKIPGISQIILESTGAGPDRQLFIYGKTQEAVSGARALLEFVERPYLVPQDCLAPLIGKGFSNIKEIIDSSGVLLIDVVKEKEANIKVLGRKKCVDLALKVIADNVEMILQNNEYYEARRQLLSKLPDSEFKDKRNGYRGAGFSGRNPREFREPPRESHDSRETREPPRPPREPRDSREPRDPLRDPQRRGGVNQRLGSPTPLSAASKKKGDVHSRLGERVPESGPSAPGVNQGNQGGAGGAGSRGAGSRGAGAKSKSKGPARANLVEMGAYTPAAPEAATPEAAPEAAAPEAALTEAEQSILRGHRSAAPQPRQKKTKAPKAATVELTGSAEGSTEPENAAAAGDAAGVLPKRKKKQRPARAFTHLKSMEDSSDVPPPVTAPAPAVTPTPAPADTSSDDWVQMSIDK